MDDNNGVDETQQAPVPEVTSHLLDALRQRIAGLENELDDVRGSVRYRAGELIMQAFFPPGLKTLASLRQLIALYRDKKKQSGITRALTSSSEGATQYSTVIAGAAPGQMNEILSQIDEPRGSSSVHVSNSCSAIRVVEAIASQPSRQTKLVVCQPDAALARRIGRLRMAGWRVVYAPPAVITDVAEIAIDAYLRTHCDQLLTPTRSQRTSAR